MTTFLELKTEVATEIGSINVTDDATALGRELNRAVRRILRQAPYIYMTSQTVTPGANADYSLAASVLVMNEAYFTSGGTNFDLERVSLQEIIRMRKASTTAVGATRWYALVGGNKLAFYPTPAAADTMTMYYVPAPTVMSADANDPATATYGPIPVDYHDLIARYAMARMASFADDQSASQGTRYWQEFNEGLMVMKREIHRSGGRRMRRARWGSSRRSVPSDPSVVVR